MIKFLFKTFFIEPHWARGIAQQVGHALSDYHLSKLVKVDKDQSDTLN